MKMTYPVTLEAAMEVAECHRVAWERAKAAKDQVVNEAYRSHLPDDYWKAEARAHGLYQSALLLVEFLSEGEEHERTQ